MSITTSQLAGRLFPAVPVPFGRDGALHEAALKRYANWMADHAIGGVAIWAHTGRGLRLSDADLGRVITTWRSELPAESIVIAAAGPLPTVGQPDQVIARARSMARRAADHGAAAILVHPPASFRDHSHRDELVLEYHARIAEIGLPLLLFYLYEAAGGISYPPKFVWGIHAARRLGLVGDGGIIRYLDLARRGALSAISRGDLDSQSS